MKTILISISKDAMRRNIVDAPFWQDFEKEYPDVRKVLVVEKEKVSWYEKEYGDAVTVRGFTKVEKTFLWGVVDFLARAGIDTHSAKYYRMTAYVRGNASFAATFIKGVISKTLVYIPGFKSFIRRMVLFSVQSDEVARIFDEVKPDVVFTPSMTDIEYDIPIAAEAKRRNIFLLGMVRSWDNLTSHNVLGVVPDRLLLQNQFLKEVAQSSIQGLRTDITEVVGLPHYDMYKHPEPYTIERTKFFDEMGLDVDRKLLLVGGSDLYSVPQMKHILVDLNEQIKSGKLEGMQVLFRPHPKFPCARNEFGMEALEYVHIDDAERGGFTFSEKLISSILHAEVVVHIASTLAIDAAVLGTPNICIGYDDPKVAVSYWESVKRTYDTFTHYERLIETGGSVLVSNPEELHTAIREYIEHPEKDAEGREEIISVFVSPFDGAASKRLTQAVGETLSSV